MNEDILDAMLAHIREQCVAMRSLPALAVTLSATGAVNLLIGGVPKHFAAATLRQAADACEAGVRPRPSARPSDN